jgi:hypothetical protein
LSQKKKEDEEERERRVEVREGGEETGRGRPLRAC